MPVQVDYGTCPLQPTNPPGILRATAEFIPHSRTIPWGAADQSIDRGMTGRERRSRPNDGKTLPTALLLGLGMAVLFVAAVKDRSSRILLGLGITLLCAAAIMAFQMPGRSDAFGGDTLRNPAPVASTAPLPVATPKAADTAAITRLVIPAIEVDAPVTEKGLDTQGVMEAPDDPVHVAWYGFSSRPGVGGNAVFAGHVDYAAVGPAVFWNLESLKSNDVIEIRLEDGTDYRYRVTTKETFDEAAVVNRIVGPAPGDSVTLITCAGNFNRATQRYDQRLVVRGDRIMQ